MADYGIKTYRLKGSLLRRALRTGMDLEGDTLRAEMGLNESCSILLPALDSAQRDYAWGRLTLEAHLGPEAILTVRAFASDESTTVFGDELVEVDQVLLDPAISKEEKEKLFLLRGGMGKAGAENVLLTGQRGRYLWVWLEITGEGRHSLENIRICNPADQFFRTFPLVYQANNDFLMRYMAIFSTMFQEFQEQINTLPDVLDVDSAPEELLPVLTSWLGLEIDETLFSPTEIRQLLKMAPQLMERKGTKWAVETVVRLFISEKVYVVERNLLQKDQLQDDTLYGTTPYDFSVMIDRRMDEKTRLRVQFLIDQFKPIRSRCHIVFLEDCGGLDGFTYLDINGAMLQNAPGSLDDGQALTGMTYLE